MNHDHISNSDDDHPNPTNTTFNQGWIQQKGAHSFSGWNKRFLQLTFNGELKYYKDEAMKNIKGTISLGDLKCDDVEESKTSSSKYYGYFDIP